MKNIKIVNKMQKSIKGVNKNIKYADKARIKLNNYNFEDKESQSEYADEKLSKIGTDISKLTNKAIKTDNKKMLERTKNTIKTAKNITRKIKQESKKITNTKRNVKNVKKASSSIFKSIKKTAKTTINVVKYAFKGTKFLINLLLVCGWVSIFIIIILCFIGLFAASSFSIFFSNETGSKTISSVIRDVNNDVYSKIEGIKNSNEYDDINIESTYSNWNEVIAVYSVKYNENGKYNVAIIDEKNESNLKSVFWDFNSIKSDIFVDEENKKLLKISINSNSKEEVMSKYNFNNNDIRDVNYLLSKEYEQLWSNLIYGSLDGNNQIVELAKQQIGNIGGEIYWRWYGFNSRVEWCAVFISWLANETGMLNDKIPKFAVVNNGISWFKSRGEWKSRGYVPRAGDIIFFDWENDGKPNHVGIVEKVEDNYIYTIEGNSTNDTCRSKKYNINSNVIYGFGLPNY